MNVNGIMGLVQAEDWQTIYTSLLQKAQTERLVSNQLVKHIAVLNPRRDDWSNEWNETKHHPLLIEQIQWELEHLRESNCIVMYFDKNTISPISLLELGLFSNTSKMVVYCPDEYFRVENVVEVCKQYHVPVVSSLEGLVAFTIDKAYM